MKKQTIGVVAKDFKKYPYFNKNYRDLLSIPDTITSVAVITLHDNKTYSDVSLNKGDSQGGRGSLYFKGQAYNEFIQNNDPLPFGRDLKIEIEWADADSSGNIAVDHWWLQANPKQFIFRDKEIGQKERYTTHNSDGNARQVPKYFKTVKPGDIVIGYETTPAQQITTICKITKGLHISVDGEAIEFEIVKQLSNPVNIVRDELKKNPALKNCEVTVNNPAGSLFHLTKEEYNAINDILLKFNAKMNYKEPFLKWLDKANLNDSSGKKTAYKRAIEILSEILHYNIFEDDNLGKLDLLYKDLILEQGADDGKYFYKDAPSYGKSGFYSASIKTFSDFLKEYLSGKILSDSTSSNQKRVQNKLSQALCIIGESGVGKSVRVKKTLENENHRTLYVIVDSMWQHLLFDYDPLKREYSLTKIAKFIKEAADSPSINYTIVFDECHKNLELINDVLLQAISLERNEGKRFISLNTIVDQKFSYLEEQNGYRFLPSNLGFIFISSKSNVILEGNSDLRNRVEIVELKIDNQDKDFSIDYLLSIRQIKQDVEVIPSN